MQTKTKDFRVDLDVRSYECDIQGIVNNAVYLNYLEYARHELLKTNNIDFVEMHEAGKDLVLVRAEIDYKNSLRSDEKFYILSSIEQESRVRFAFKQNIYRTEDDKHILQAKVTGTCLVNGKPKLSEELSLLLSQQT